jgi:hypothetical protein
VLLVFREIALVFVSEGNLNTETGELSLDKCTAKFNSLELWRLVMPGVLVVTAIRATCQTAAADFKQVMLADPPISRT